MKKFNFNEFIYFLLLACMSGGFVYLIVTDSGSFYVGEKMNKYIYFSAVLLAVMALFQFQNIFTPKSNNYSTAKYLPIIIAIIIIIISVMHQKTFRHAQLDNFLINAENINSESIQEKRSLTVDEKDDSPVSITSDNLEVLEEIQKEPEKFTGREITLEGFVCKEKYFGETQFAIGRTITTCCAADSKITGILADYADSSEINENDWVYVKGSLEFSTINDDDGVSHRVPILRVDKLEKKEKPAENK